MKSITLKDMNDEFMKNSGLRRGRKIYSKASITFETGIKVTVESFNKDAEIKKVGKNDIDIIIFGHRMRLAYPHLKKG